jgi:transposase
VITEGQRHDIKSAPALVEMAAPLCLLGDKAFDANSLRADLQQRGCVAVIPSKADRVPQIPHDKELYKARSEIECTFSLLKQARRFATRYEKTLRNYTAVVALGCALLWLRI